MQIEWRAVKIKGKVDDCERSQCDCNAHLVGVGERATSESHKEVYS